MSIGSFDGMAESNRPAHWLVNLTGTQWSLLLALVGFVVAAVNALDFIEEQEATNQSLQQADTVQTQRLSDLELRQALSEERFQSHQSSHETVLEAINNLTIELRNRLP